MADNLYEAAVDTEAAAAVKTEKRIVKTEEKIKSANPDTLLKKDTSGESHCAYLLLCSDGTFYGGYTNNLEKRLKAHNSGKGAKYTRSRLPVELIYYEVFPSKEEAMSREWHIKRLTRRQKENLISGFTNERSKSND